MKSIGKKIVLLSFLTLTFCNQKKEKVEIKQEVTEESDKFCFELGSTTGFYTRRLIDNEKMEVLYSKIRKGDTLAYIKCEEIYMLSGHAGAFLSYSIEMANKRKYPRAYYDVYNYLHGIDNNYIESSEFIEVGLSKLNPETRNMAFSYLKKAASMGHKKAIEELKKYDSKGNLK